MNHAATSLHMDPRPKAGAAAWWHHVTRWLLRVWVAECIRAERKERFVPYY